MSGTYETWEVDAYCSCGCGTPAEMIHNMHGVIVLLPETDPATHLRNYKRKLEFQKEQARMRLQVQSKLEHMTQKQFEKVRCQI